MPPEPDGKRTDIENRRFETETERGLHVRSGRLKRDKSRYVGSTESKIPVWEKLRLRRGQATRQGRLMIAIGGAMTFVLVVLVIGNALLSGKRSTVSTGELLEQKAEAIENLEELQLDLESTLEAYLVAETVEERLKYVRQPEVVKPLMMKYYAFHPWELKKKELSELQVITKQYRANKLEEGHFVYITLGRMLDGVVAPFIIEERNETFAVDWETHVAYNPLTRDQLLERRPTDPKPFRIYLNGSDRYIEPFNAEEHLALQLVFPDKIESVDAFIARDNPGTKVIERILASKHLAPVILNLKVPAGFSGRAVVVDSFVQPRWFVTD